MSLIRNERLKLFAAYLNGLAVAIFAVGGLAPVFSSLYGGAVGNSGIFIAIVSVVCFVVSAALLCGKLVVEGAARMTTFQMFSLFLMPVAGLVIAAVGLYLTRHTRRHIQPGE